MFSKRFSIILFTSFLFISGCNPFNQPIRKETAEVFVNSDISEKDLQVIKGDKYIFKYASGIDPIPGAIDDEYTDVILFSVNKDQVDNFSFKDDELLKIDAYSDRICFCPPSEPSKKISKGSIKGQKINDNMWKVEGNFDKLRFLTTFKLNNQGLNK